ncbi:glycine--tRNA ligase subunit beta [Simiduia curdlanivorans]|uniref:Glycine--tRNA ligase beta subunit n=1 Tax=Simiduia curdlanivorans TaxID=1492769 RepID=A0ABV8V1X2_9GAMM|nr:glycine--tRNA ligase subunit beta [Simiduia curdlanivorans]MDN3638007.1 glycine--tRNA ligase subunit beta [Simiduia curdlanivorans]
MTQQTFLVELGTEELPPKALRKLSEAFSDSIVASLKARGLEFGAVTPYAAPRRLALRIEQLPAQTPVTQAEVWGPPAKIAFDNDGNPSKAGLAFAEKNNVALDAVSVKNDGKADKLFLQVDQGGEAVTQLLAPMVTKALADLPIPKRMRWGAKRDEFVRPVHWLVMLYGSDIVSGQVMGLTAGRATRGHRFHFNYSLDIQHADDYAAQLKSTAFVLADFEERKALITQQVNAAAAKINGVAHMEPALLEEVTALVEWPVALAGKFEERFLSVPAEALISSMGEHQKYFHVLDANQQLMPYFITVANIESKDPQQVISGNERVIRPRLSDAAFFFDTDKKVSLESLRERLKSIVFQAQLGSIFDKTERVAGLAQAIAQQLNANADLAKRAGQLCKSDLVTNMVGEFDTMQGIAGYYYAINDGEDAEVARALQEQYLPRFAGDVLPDTMTGTILALADRLDTLTGIFGIGQLPTGSKDPFALRRASLGALRLLVEKQLPLDLNALLTAAVAQHKDLKADAKDLVNSVQSYMLERFVAWYEDENFAPEIFMAVSAKQLSVPLDIDNRVRAVKQFGDLPAAQALAAANKRVANILAKLDSEPSDQIVETLLVEPAEKILAEQIALQKAKTQPMFASSKFTEALTSLADLQPAVDAFFDQVMVMADDEAVRNNRLALLMQLRNLFLQIADISLLVPAK